jgi:hypothetical protein
MVQSVNGPTPRLSSNLLARLHYGRAWIVGALVVRRKEPGETGIPEPTVRRAAIRTTHLCALLSKQYNEFGRVIREANIKAE